MVERHAGVRPAGSPLSRCSTRTMPTNSSGSTTRVSALPTRSTSRSRSGSSPGCLDAGPLDRRCAPAIARSVGRSSRSLWPSARSRHVPCPGRPPLLHPRSPRSPRCSPKPRDPFRRTPATRVGIARAYCASPCPIRIPNPTSLRPPSSRRRPMRMRSRHRATLAPPIAEHASATACTVGGTGDRHGVVALLPTSISIVSSRRLKNSTIRPSAASP